MGDVQLKKRWTAAIFDKEVVLSYLNESSSVEWEQGCHDHDLSARNTTGVADDKEAASPGTCKQSRTKSKFALRY